MKHRYLLCASRVYGFGSDERGRELFAKHGVLEDADGDCVECERPG